MLNMKKAIGTGLILILFIISLSGCIQTETPVSKGTVKFTITDVIITNELNVTTRELVNSTYINVTKTEVLNNSKVVIISLMIENKEDRILEVKESIRDGLIDNKRKTHWREFAIEVNNTTYMTFLITSIEEEELFGGRFGTHEDFPSNSSNLRKIVYLIPSGRTPKELKLTYGLKENEYEEVDRLFSISLKL